MDIATIFGVYDIRGLVGEQLTKELYLDFGRTYATFLKKRSITSAIVGWDLRPTSQEFAEAFINGLVTSSIDVYKLGLTTTPLLYFSQYDVKTNGAAMITASHNPTEYNGLKLATGYSETMFIEDLKEFRGIFEKKEFHSGERISEIVEINIEDSYIDFVKSLFKEELNCKVVVNTQNASPGLFVPKILRSVGIEVIEQDTKLDKTFPLGMPDPMDSKMQARLGEMVRKEKADIGFSFDGDGDRLGVVDENGETISSDYIISIFAEDILKKNSGAKIVYNAMCSKIVPETIAFHQGVGIGSRVGHNFVKSKIVQEKALFGGELAAHFFFADNFFGHDDPIFTALRLLKILHERKQSVSQIFSVFDKYKSSIEIKLGINRDIRFQYVENNVKNALLDTFPNASVSEIDGVRLDWETGMVIVRASQNGPYVTVKFESTSEEEYLLVQNRLRQMLESLTEFNWDYHHSAGALKSS
jgi:phosphomannomutase/phosphoglucomutase